MMRDINEVLRLAGAEDAAEALKAEWDSSLASAPEGPLFFLTPEFVAEACGYVGLPEEIVALAQEAARAVERSPALRALAWHAHWLQYRHKAGVGRWPLLTKALGDLDGMFYVLVVLSGFREARQFHLSRGLPPEIVRDSVLDVLLSMQRFQRMHGRWGLTPEYAGGWLRHHFRGEIFRLGRIQFMHRALPGVLVAFRRRATGEVLCLAPAGNVYRRDGQLNGAGGLTETEGVWTARLETDGGEIIGHPIDPATGAARREEMNLRADDWRKVLEKGDIVLDMHIPGDGPLDFEACGESLRRALDFFPRCFPERTFKAFWCTSWLFDAQLEAMLPPTSNIIRFLREFYLAPVSSDNWSAVRFVFDMDIPWDAPQVDLSRAPRDTTLRRAMLDHLARGGRLRKAGALLFPQDMRWGGQVYRVAPSRGAWTRASQRSAASQSSIGAGAP